MNCLLSMSKSKSFGLQENRRLLRILRSYFCYKIQWLFNNNQPFHYFLIHIKRNIIRATMNGISFIFISRTSRLSTAELETREERSGNTVIRIRLSNHILLLWIWIIHVATTKICCLQINSWGEKSRSSGGKPHKLRFLQ